MRRVLDGGTFFESPRWHDGRWWVSDFFRHVVLSLDVDGGDVREEATVPGQPSGLGWAPDGSLLVVSMLDRAVLRRATGAAPGSDLEPFADLSAVATGPCNDMVVGPDGGAWVGSFGFDYWGGAAFSSASLAHVDVDGAVTAAAEELLFPNGSVVTPDGTTLIVAETFAGRLTAFTIGGDGSLSGRWTWAEVPGTAPDGCCLDARGRVWFADALGRRCLLVAEGGTVVQELLVPDGLGVFACMLGGDDGRTLLVCCAPDSDRARRSATREAVLLAADVEVARAGRP